MQCIVLLRKGEETLPALKDVKEKVEELNDPASGRMLPGTRDRALLRPHRLAPHHHRDRDRKPVHRRRCWSSRSCSCS